VASTGLYDIDLMREVQDELVDEIVEEVIELVQDSVGPDGETYGDVPMTPGDRISAFIMDAQIGQLDILSYINQQYYQKRVRQYIDDVKHSPFIAHTYESRPQPPENGY
jgi:hypothetical protein